MEHGRRRRNRGSNSVLSLPATAVSAVSATPSYKPWTLLGGVCSLMIITCLLSVVYMTLEYHCSTCKAQSSIHNITKHIEDIASNLSFMKTGYKNLEAKINQFSLEIPKVAEKVSSLESLASSLQGSFWRNPYQEPSTHEQYNIHRVIKTRNLKNLSAKMFNKLKRRPHVTPTF